MIQKLLTGRDRAELPSDLYRGETEGYREAEWGSSNQGSENLAQVSPGPVIRPHHAASASTVLPPMGVGRSALLFLVALTSLRRVLLSYRRHLHIIKGQKRTVDLNPHTDIVLRIIPCYEGVLQMLTKYYTTEKALDPVRPF